MGTPEALVASRRQRLDLAAGRLAQALVQATRVHATRLARVSGRLGPETLGRAIRVGRERLDRLAERARRAEAVGRERRAAALARLSGRIAPQALSVRIDHGRERSAALGRRLEAAFALTVERRRARLDGLARLIATLSYRAVLARGFALVRGPDGRPLRAAAAVAVGDRLAIEFQDGRVTAVAESGGDGGGAAEDRSAPAVSPKPRKRAGEKAAGQGTLF